MRAVRSARPCRSARENKGQVCIDTRLSVKIRDKRVRYEFIRSRSPAVVKLEIENLFLAYNLMRYIMSRGQPGRTKPRIGIASAAAAVRCFLAVLQTIVKSGRSCGASSRQPKPTARTLPPCNRPKVRPSRCGNRHQPLRVRLAWNGGTALAPFRDQPGPPVLVLEPLDLVGLPADRRPSAEVFQQPSANGQQPV